MLVNWPGVHSALDVFELNVNGAWVSCVKQSSME